MDILEDMIELIMKVYLILMRDLRKCLIELDLILLKSDISGFILINIRKSKFVMIYFWEKH